MTQSVLPFAATPTAVLPAANRPAARLPVPSRRPSGSGFEAVGFEIGWDHAHHRLLPPAEHLTPGHPVRQGWEAGQATFGSRTLRPTPPVRKWLQLRLGAWRRGIAFESHQVTPRLLAEIDVPVCPITRERLTHATGTPSDASVDRVFNGAGYAAGNLAVMSAHANGAKSDYAWDDALRFVRQIELGRLGQIDGLGAAEWSRLAVLMSFATPLPHEQAARLPLLVLPPNRLRLINPVQALQAVLTLQFARPGYARRIADLAAAVKPAAARQAFQVVMHTLLPRRVAAGPQAAGPALRQALEDAWRHPLLLQRWQRLALQLDADGCERLLRHAERRAGRDAGWRWLDGSQATEGWALGRNGAA